MPTHKTIDWTDQQFGELREITRQQEVDFEGSTDNQDQSKPDTREQQENGSEEKGAFSRLAGLWSLFRNYGGMRGDQNDKSDAARREGRRR